MSRKTPGALLRGAVFAVFALTYSSVSTGADWPIYKGNIYFTGNNDEVVVKTNTLKWLFQAGERAANPVVSDDRIFFLDVKSHLYCVREDNGALIWKKDIKEISKVFKSYSRAAGKVKYPLIKDNFLFVSDPIAIYAFDKNTGNVIWARTGLREQKTPPQGLRGYTSVAMVDGIYADPIISEDRIYYGTRNMFLSRDIRRGHEGWSNEDIKTYSGFPTFYDKYLFTQSMDFSTGRYTVYCLMADSGKEVWSRTIPKPMKIYPPVIYRQKVYIPSSTSMHCLALSDGKDIWTKDYGKYITSNPSFTDRAVLFALDNASIAAINPENGDILSTIELGPQSSPYFVTIRDQIYIATNVSQPYKDTTAIYGKVRAINFTTRETLWEYRTPFPGGVSQPVASKGILFLPAGSYLYAIGSEFGPGITPGGDALAKGPRIEAKPPEKKSLKEDKTVTPKEEPKKPEKKVPTRKMHLKVTGEGDAGVQAQVEVKKREKGEIVYRKTMTVNGSGEIEVPSGDNVEVLVNARGYVPKKEIINETDRDKTIRLEKIARGKAFVVDNIYFEFDKAYLKKDSLDILDRLVSLMKENPGLKVEVRGHTDSMGDKAYNRKLSERRADAVIEYMVKNGISPERVNAVGLGDTKPIAPNTTADGRRKNRRTEFFFLD